MITFPNAKINIGLRITRRRPDGYHDLETLFQPVGIYSGTPQNPVSFCDMLEINFSQAGEERFAFSGRPIDCPLEKNLVFKAVRLFEGKIAEKVIRDGRIADPEKSDRKFEILDRKFDVSLVKNLPDGAGLGGGSADASFVLRMLNELTGSPFSDHELEVMALSLGADCPVFIKNRACYAEGVGERMEPVDLGLEGKWCVIVKPQVYISTKEAFAGVVPKADPDRFPLKELGRLPVSEWKEVAVNDFEASVFPRYPELSDIKERLYSLGAEYASMSGSGSALFGLFLDATTAHHASASFAPTHQTWPLLL